MATTWSRRTARNGEVELAVFEAGSATSPPLVLVHGWPDTHQMWDGIAAELGDAFRVIAYDTRGQGESGEPDDDAAYELPVLARDFLAVADEISPDEPVHVLAHDWGSVEMWEAVCDPEIAPRVASFTSLSGPSVDHLGAWARERLRGRSPRQVGQVLAQGVSSIYVPFFVSPLAPPTFRRVASRERWARLLKLAEGIDPSPEHYAPTLVHDMVSGLRRYRANLRRTRTPDPRRTAVPVLQLVATKDTAIRPATLRCAEPYVDSLTRAEVPYGHWVALSHPDVVAGETRQFIATLDERVEPGPYWSMRW